MPAHRFEQEKLLFQLIGAVPPLSPEEKNWIGEATGENQFVYTIPWLLWHLLYKADFPFLSRTQSKFLVCCVVNQNWNTGLFSVTERHKAFAHLWVKYLVMVIC